MKTSTRIEKLFQSIKRGNIKLTEGKVKHSVYTLDIQNVKNINPKESPEIHPTNKWVISVYYRGSLISFMAFDADFSDYRFSFFYPFATLTGNKHYRIGALLSTETI